MAERDDFVALGGLHVTALPGEAALHADAIFLGPAEQTFPQFLSDLRAGRPLAIDRSTADRTLDSVPSIRRDLIGRSLRRFQIGDLVLDAFHRVACIALPARKKWWSRPLIGSR